LRRAAALYFDANLIAARGEKKEHIMPETGMPKSKEKTKNHPSFILSIKSSRQVPQSK
jgi:hypothetical protein